MARVDGHKVVVHVAQDLILFRRTGDRARLQRIETWSPVELCATTHELAEPKFSERPSMQDAETHIGVVNWRGNRDGPGGALVDVAEVVRELLQSVITFSMRTVTSRG